MVLGRALLRPAAAAVRRSAGGEQRRRMAGLKIHDQNHAYAFGEVPGVHKKEGWETIWYATIAASTAMFVAIAYRPTTGIEVRIGSCQLLPLACVLAMRTPSPLCAMQAGYVHACKMSVALMSCCKNNNNNDQQQARAISIHTAEPHGMPQRARPLHTCRTTAPPVAAASPRSRRRRCTHA
jgi:hypothetical protein